MHMSMHMSIHKQVGVVVFGSPGAAHQVLVEADREYAKEPSRRRYIAIDILV